MQEWRLNRFPGLPLAVLDKPLNKEIFPNIPSEPPLVQLKAISSHSITCYSGEETNALHATISFQIVVESEKVSPQGGPGTANKCTVPWWLKKFCKGDKSLEDEDCSGQPSEVENDQLRAIIKADPLTTT